MHPEAFSYLNHWLSSSYNYSHLFTVYITAIPKGSSQVGARCARFLRTVFSVSSSLLQRVDVAAPSCDPDIVRVCRSVGMRGMKVS